MCNKKLKPFIVKVSVLGYFPLVSMNNIHFIIKSNVISIIFLNF